MNYFYTATTILIYLMLHPRTINYIEITVYDNFETTYDIDVTAFMILICYML